MRESLCLMVTREFREFIKTTYLPGSRKIGEYKPFCEAVEVLKNGYEVGFFGNPDYPTLYYGGNAIDGTVLFRTFRGELTSFVYIYLYTSEIDREKVLNCATQVLRTEIGNTLGIEYADLYQEFAKTMNIWVKIYAVNSKKEKKP